MAPHSTRLGQDSAAAGSCQQPPGMSLQWVSTNPHGSLPRSAPPALSQAQVWESTVTSHTGKHGASCWVPVQSSPTAEKSHQPGGGAKAKEKIGLQPWTSRHTHERLLPSYTTSLLIQHTCLETFDSQALPPSIRRDGAAARQLMLPGKKR